jgi:hypothetical protein
MGPGRDTRDAQSGYGTARLKVGQIDKTRSGSRFNDVGGRQADAGLPVQEHSQAFDGRGQSSRRSGRRAAGLVTDDGDDDLV